MAVQEASRINPQPGAPMDRDQLGPESEGDRRKSGPIAWMAGHTVAANLLMVVFLVGGLIFSGQIKKRCFPISNWIW